MKLFNFATLLAVALPFSGVAAGGHHARVHHSRHTDIARRAEGDLQTWKRGSNSRWSFYDVGLGACGKHNVESDFIVALNSDQFGSGYPGPHCFKWITMQYNGKTTRAQITDRCPGCGNNGLDLSRGLFRFFDSEDKGLIYGNWFFDGEGGGAPPPPPHTTKKPAPPPPPPTPTWHPPKTIIKPDPIPTWTPDKTTTHERSKTSSPSSSKASSASGGSAKAASASVSYASGAVSGLAAPAATGSIQGGNTENLNNLNLALVGFGGLAIAGVQAN